MQPIEESRSGPQPVLPTGKARFRRRAAIIAVLLAGVTLSVWAFLVMRTREARMLEAEFRRRASDRIEAIEAEFTTGLDLVNATAGLFRASESVTRGEFTAFVVPFLATHQEFAALSWLPRVTAGERRAHEERTRATFPGYQITQIAPGGGQQRAGSRDAYYPVHYIEPIADNRSALGFDIGSETVRRAALERARDTGEPAITHAVRLVQEKGDELAVLASIAVFRPGAPTGNPVEREAELRGYVNGVFRIREVIEHAFSALEPAGIDVWIIDETAPAGQRLLHVHHSRMRNVPRQFAGNVETYVPQGLALKDRFDAAGVDWTIHCAPTPGFVAANTTSAPATVLLAGLLVTAFAAGSMFLQGRHTERLDHEIRRRERAQRREEGLSRVLETSLNEIYVFDAETLRFVMINRGARENLGYPRNRLGEMTPLDIKPEYDRASFDEALRPLRDGSEAMIELETVHRRVDGSLYDVELQLQMSDLGGVQVFVAIARDVTERNRAEQSQRRLEAQLLQSQKMEALGQLAGGVAHDFNNLLTVILGNAETLLASEAPNRAMLEQIVQAGERASGLTRQLLTFSRKQPRLLQVLCPNQVLHTMEGILRTLLGERVRLELETGEELEHVTADNSQLEQVVLNLVLNAKDAMPDGGVVSIGTANVVVLAGDSRLPAGAEPGRHAVIEVRDKGKGIPEDVLPHIFEPFFTTKPLGRGTGLGLSTVYGIVSQSGGFIEVDSTPGEGSTFRVFWPAVAAQRAAAERPEETPATRGTETILVCEDEPLVRELTCRILEDASYEVLAAANGREALDLLRDKDEPPDLLLTDTIMPEMNGRELAETLTARHAGLKVLFVSGYTQDVLAPEGVLDGGTEFLAKPFTRKDLLRRVRNILDRPVQSTRWPASN